MKLRTEFTFDAAHRLVGYSGKCRNLHGHMWRVVVTIIGDGLDANGILWDFGNTKLLKELLDHKTILKDDIENREIIKSCQNIDMDSIYLMRENPTAENLAIEILDHLRTSNPNLRFIVKIYESPKSYAELGNE